jgi:hypothetical protein
MASAGQLHAADEAHVAAVGAADAGALAALYAPATASTRSQSVVGGWRSASSSR